MSAQGGRPGRLVAGFGRDCCQRQFVIRRGTDEQPIPNQKYRVTMDDGRVIDGVTDAMGQTQMAVSEGIQNAAIELLYD